MTRRFATVEEYPLVQRVDRKTPQHPQILGACGMGRSYLSHVKYRLGAYYSKPYYKIDGVRAADEYGVTAGFGLPIPRTRSVLSLSAQYVRTKGTQAAFLNENTLRICIGVTFNERWFFKRKVD